MIVCYDYYVERERKYAGVLELVDSADLKSVDIYIVRVRFPSPVPFAFTK